MKCPRLALVPTLAVLLAAASPSPAFAQDTDWNRYTLEDLGGLYVRMEVAESCTAAGVSPSEYEADLSLQLIESDVGVLTMEEMLAHPALPELRVSVDCASGSGNFSGAMGWTIGLRVQQAAQMLRDTQISLPESVTWFSTRVGVSPTSGAADAVGDALEGQVALFIEAWAAAHADDDPGS